MKNLLLLLALPFAVNATTVKPITGISDQGVYVGAQVRHESVTFTIDSQASMRVGKDIDDIHIYADLSDELGAGVMMTRQLHERINLDIGASVNTKLGEIKPHLSSFVQFSFSL